jgi:2'-5' RNA ligase
MNYINKGKRDVIIIPEFSNVQVIEKIREKFDELYGILPPHITLAFPFNSDIPDDILESRLMEIAADFKPFKIRLKGISFVLDKRVDVYYIFLDFIEGEERIKDLHERIYKEILQEELIFDYRPHITLGCTKEKINLSLDEEFESTVDKNF